jgi:hypothetical protein
MCKSVLFQHLLSAVSSETEIPSDEILSTSRIEEVVDARYILVCLLARCGYTRHAIASLIHQSVRSVGYILSSSVRREQKHIVRINLENIRKRMGNNAFSASS